MGLGLPVAGGSGNRGVCRLGYLRTLSDQKGRRQDEQASPRGRIAASGSEDKNRCCGRPHRDTGAENHQVRRLTPLRIEDHNLALLLARIGILHRSTNQAIDLLDFFSFTGFHLIDSHRHTCLGPSVSDTQTCLRRRPCSSSMRWNCERALLSIFRKEVQGLGVSENWPLGISRWLIQ